MGWLLRTMQSEAVFDPGGVGIYRYGNAYRAGVVARDRDWRGLAGALLFGIGRVE